jgi:hypothetical protein
VEKTSTAISPFEDVEAVEATEAMGEASKALEVEEDTADADPSPASSREASEPNISSLLL